MRSKEVFRGVSPPPELGPSAEGSPDAPTVELVVQLDVQLPVLFVRGLLRAAESPRVRRSKW